MSGLLLGVVLGGSLIAAAAVPLPASVPALAVELPRAPHHALDLDLPFPVQGESAVGIPSFSVYYASSRQERVPIASLTKLMTAYVTLRSLPLARNALGPRVKVTPWDLAVYEQDIAMNQSSVPVVVGEVLDERQLLEGLLVHSAGNYAAMLGVLVAGSDRAMVARMNATARALHLAATSYVDVSGYDPRSVSNARDQLRLAVALMSYPTFAEIVRLTSVRLPVAGVVDTYTPDLGVRGVVGVKTGFTSQAGGCDVMAYEDHVGRRDVLVLSVVLGQVSYVPGPLAAAGHGALMLATSLSGHLRGFVVTKRLRRVGRFGWPTRAVPVVASTTLVVPTFPGVPTRVAVVDTPWGSGGAGAWDRVATLLVTSGAVRESTPLVVTGSLTRASLWQRLR